MFNGVWWCPSCKVGFVPMHEIDKRLKNHAGRSAVDTPGERDHKVRVAHQIMGAWNSICNGLGNIWTGPVGKMIEVGFGNAGVIREFHRLQWEALGIDPDKSAV